ncbi:MAG: hypothetical protein WBA54_06960 [Acidaminobacteraceae bacterium]
MVYKKYMVKIFGVLFLIFVLNLFSACSTKISSEDLPELDELSRNIFLELEVYKKEVSNLAIQLEKIYNLSESEKMELISNVDENQYTLSENGVFYRKELSEGSAVFVSGYTPINDLIKDAVYFTEGIDSTFKTIMKKHDEIAQVYYNDENSYNRIYPSFDVLTQYQPKMNIPDFNFYYLADLGHNPEKIPVWVKEPYVDPAGRGWMISTIAPVYSDDYLQGVAGIDLTITEITKKHLQNEDLFMITAEGIVVTISEEISTILSLPILKNHKYIETIKSDSYMVDDFNLMKSKTEEVRNFAQMIINSKENIVLVDIDGTEYRVSKSNIDELDWIVIKMVKN